MLQHFFNALGLRLSMFQSLRMGAGTQIQADSKSIDTGFDVISSYLYIDPLPRRPNHYLTDLIFASFESLSKPFSTPFFRKSVDRSEN